MNKIFTPNIKSVNELTKYISPKDITKARYEKYNAPIINDGNQACDHFFRMEELLNKKKDIVTPFTPYSIDDVPVIDRTSPLAHHIRTLEGSNAEYIESDLPYYVDILGENKRIYIESYGTKGPKYPYKASFNTESVLDNRELYKNCSVDNVVNIRYFAEKYAKNDPKGIELEGLRLLQNGYPLEAIINIIKEASTKTENGETQCSRIAMKFIAEYPNLRRYMFTYANDRSEVFDTVGARMFPNLLKTCGSDEKLAYRVLWDCRVELPDGGFVSDPDLLKLGQDLFKIGNTWSEEKAKIVQSVSLRNPEYYKQYARKALKNYSALHSES